MHFLDIYDNLVPPWVYIDPPYDVNVLYQSSPVSTTTSYMNLI